MENYFEELKVYSKTFCQYIPSAFIIFAGLSITHYITSNLYPPLCVPLTFTGFIMAPFVVVSPHCQALRWIIHYTGEQIKNIWIWVGGYLVYYIGTYITPYIKKNNDVEDSKKEE
jgi:hypothetical protein